MVGQNDACPSAQRHFRLRSPLLPSRHPRQRCLGRPGHDALLVHVIGSGGLAGRTRERNCGTFFQLVFWQALCGNVGPEEAVDR